MKLKIFISLMLFSGCLNAATFYLKSNNGKKIENIQVSELINNSNGEDSEPETINCTLPEVVNAEGTACENNIAAVGWIDMSSDSCGGMKQSDFDSNIYFARSKSSTQNTNLEIPQGYRWLSISEYNDYFNQSTVPTKNDNIYVYYTRCGLSYYPVSLNEGREQYSILFSDSEQGMHSGNYEYMGGSYHYSYLTNFFGYVLYKEY